MILKELPEGTLVTIRRQIAHVEFRHGGWLALGRYGGGFPRDACLGHVARTNLQLRVGGTRLNDAAVR